MREDISGTGKRRKAESLMKSREGGLTPAEKTQGEGVYSSGALGRLCA